MLSPTHLIYLADKKTMPEKGESRCSVCGQRFAQTYDIKKDIIPVIGTKLFSSNTDISLVQLGGRTCEACAYSIKSVYKKSFWATPNEWHLFPNGADKKKAIIMLLRDPPTSPYIVCLDLKGKGKNLIHRAVINYNVAPINIVLYGQDGNVNSLWLTKRLISEIDGAARPNIIPGTPVAHIMNFLRKGTVN